MSCFVTQTQPKLCIDTQKNASTPNWDTERLILFTFDLYEEAQGGAGEAPSLPVTERFAVRLRVESLFLLPLLSVQQPLRGNLVLMEVGSF